MSVADIMRGFFSGNGQGPQSVTPQQQNTGPGGQVTNTTAPAASPTQGNNTVPGADNSGIPANQIAALPATTTADGKSPLESYSELFKLVPDAKAPASLVPTFTVDQAAIQAAAGKLDFTKIIDANLFDKASKGDSAALAQVINTAAQAGFAQSLVSTGTIVKDALTKQADVFHKDIMPDILRRHEISRTVADGSPLYNNPAVAPLFKMVEDGLAVKFPTASPSEIRQHAQTYFDSMSTEVLKARGFDVVARPTQDTPGNTFNTGNDMDWEKWGNS